MKYNTTKLFDSTVNETQIEKVEISNLTNLDLVSYLASYGISKTIALEQCMEIHYTDNNKQCQAVAFPNANSGYEIRYKELEGCVSAKGISIIKADNDEDDEPSNSCCIFEDFIDYLSFLTMREQSIDFTISLHKTDYIILNSVSQINIALQELEAYENISCFFSNNELGKSLLDLIVDTFSDDKMVFNKSVRYKGYKTLDDFLMRKPMDQHQPIKISEHDTTSAVC